MVKSLLDDTERIIHASRMQYYADSSFNVTSELRDHVARQGLSFTVSKFSDYRLLPDAWEPLLSI